MTAEDKEVHSVQTLVNIRNFRKGEFHIGGGKVFAQTLHFPAAGNGNDMAATGQTA